MSNIENVKQTSTDSKQTNLINLTKSKHKLIIQDPNEIDIESNESLINDKISNYSIIDSKQLRKDIITNKLYPYYLTQIDEHLVYIKIWSRLHYIFSTISVIMISASTIVSFSVPQFPNVNYINYIAGVLGVIAVMCDRFSHYCSAEGTSNTQRINLLMKSIGINDTIPDIMSFTTPNLKDNSSDDLKNLESLQKK